MIKVRLSNAIREALLTASNAASTPVQINKPRAEDFGQIKSSGLGNIIEVPGSADNAKVLNFMNIPSELSIEAGGNVSTPGIELARGNAVIRSRSNRKQGSMSNAQLLMKLENSVWFDAAREYSINKELPDQEFLYRWDALGSEVLNTSRFSHPGSANEAYGFYLAYTDLHRHFLFSRSPVVQGPAMMQRDIAILYYMRRMIVAFFNSIGYKVESQLLDSYYGRGLALSFNPKVATYNQDWQESNSLVGYADVWQTITGPDGQQYQALKPWALARAGRYTMSADRICFTPTKDSLHRFEATVTDTNGVSKVCKVLLRNNVTGQYLSTSPLGVNDMDKCLLADGRELIDCNYTTRVRYQTVAANAASFGMVFVIGVNDIGPIDTARIQIWPDFFPEYETRVNPKYLLPKEWTIDKMLKGLTHAFGLDWDTDNTRKVVRFDPEDGATITWWNNGNQSLVIPPFYTNSPLDLTNDPHLSNVSLSFDETQIDRKKYLLGFNSGQPSWANYNKARRVPSQCVLLSPAGEAKQEEKFNEFFTGCIHVKHPYPNDLGDKVSIQMPMYSKEVYPEQSYWQYADRQNTGYMEPVLLFHAGQRDGLDGLLYRATNVPSGVYDQPGQKTPLTWATDPVPAAFAINYNDPNGVDPVLSYSDITTDTGFRVKGLFKRFMLKKWAQLSRNITWQGSFWWPLGKWLTYGRVGKIRHRGVNIKVTQARFVPGKNRIEFTGSVQEFPTADDVGNITMGS